MPADSSSELTRKVTKVLSALAQRGETGVRLVDIANMTQVPRPTVHRILKELIDNGFAAQSESGTYLLGHAVFELSLSAPSPIVDMTTLRDLAQALADRCGDTVYVGVRQFDATNYVVRAEGDSPLQTRIPVGTSRPLARSYTGIALLPFVSPEQRARAIDLRVSGLDPDAAATTRATIERLLAQVVERGYCNEPDFVLPGVDGIGTPIRTEGSAPYASVAISAVTSRLTAERVEALIPQLMSTERQMRACFAVPPA